MAVSNGAQDVAPQMHLNMMTDTLIANLPPDSVRAVIRSMIAIHPQITPTFERQVRELTQQRAKAFMHIPPQSSSVEDLKQMQGIVRCMLGSGMVFESLPLLSVLVSRTTKSSLGDDSWEQGEGALFLASVDGDVVQGMTAAEKALVVPEGARQLTDKERSLIQTLHDAIAESIQLLRNSSSESPLGRGRAAVEGVLGIAFAPTLRTDNLPTSTPAPPAAAESFRLGDSVLPRIFSGLWQMSSPAWGSAPIEKIIGQFNEHVQKGLTAFDMGDHYGDAELLFGRFRSQYAHQDRLFAATKLCVFNRVKSVSREMMEANVSERCRRLQQSRLNLLQFHWQHYEDSCYLEALQHLATDKRVGQLGLCNFDTANMQRVLDAGIPIHSNQVQFSLVDCRPLERMVAVCTQYNIKLLTYGTLCGGFLSDRWLDQPEPNLYGNEKEKAITPSQRKYFSMICNWGGWNLLQELLHVLRSIATKHNVPDVSNVATRWVLDSPAVGAVLVGSRMGLSDHSDGNLASFGWHLDEQDLANIESVLAKSKRKQMYRLLGDCGAEYRQPV